jgi:hypothetical protein
MENPLNNRNMSSIKNFHANSTRKKIEGPILGEKI